MKISVSMIVKNEESCLRTALESVKEADEIVICDTGSTDSTIEIAKEYTDKVYTDYKWNDSFAEARNYSASKCTGDYILIIDADEYLEEGAMERIRKFEGEALEFHTISAKTGQIHGSIRLYKNRPETKWFGAAHNYLNIEPSHKSNIKMYYAYSKSHELDPDRTLRILQNEIRKNPKAAREMYYLGQEYISRKQYQKAISTFKKYVRLSKFPAEKADAYLYMARCQYVLGLKEDARRSCLEAIYTNPDLQEAHLLMADVSQMPHRLRWRLFADQCDNTNVLFFRPPKKIKVTQLTLEDFAGSGFRMVQAVRNADPLIDVEQIVVNKSAFGINCGMTANEIGHKAVQHRIDTSDIIHFKGDWVYNGEFAGFKLPEGAKKIYSVSGSFFRRGMHPSVSFGETPLEDYKADLLTALSPDLVYNDDWTFVPVAWNTFDYKWKRGEKFKVLHIPSDPEKKGTQIIIDAMKLLNRDDVNFICVNGLSHEESVELKKNCDLYIDQVNLPVYGNSAIEAMSFGVPVMNYDTGLYGDIPLIGVDRTPEAIADKLNEVLDWNKLEEISKQTFEYVQKIHGSAGKYWAMKYKELCEKQHIKEKQ
jgi:glycosyltransferase involved in cell wall biosynthesis